MNLTILRSYNRDGATYALEYYSKKYLHEKFAENLRFRSRIFIAHECNENKELVSSSIVKSILILLTNLNEDQLKKINYVIFLEPVNDREIVRYKLGEIE